MEPAGRISITRIPAIMLSSPGLPRVVLQVTPPVVIAFLSAEDTSRLIKVANGSGQGISGVEIVVVEFEVQNIGEHGGYLFFGGVAVAGDRLLDLFRRVLRDPHSFGYRRGYSYSLRSAQFEHRLWVLTIKRSFDGHFPGRINFDDTLQALEDMLQFILVLLHFFQIDHPHIEQPEFLLRHLYDGIPQNIGAGVNAKQAVCVFLRIQTSILINLKKFRVGETSGFSHRVIARYLKTRDKTKVFKTLVLF